MPPGNYQTGVGSEVVLTPEGRLHLASDPRLLAGSAQSMLWGVSRLVRSGLASLADAWAMASLHPATLLGIPQQRGLAIGAPADLVTLEPEIDEVLRVRQVVRAGDVVSG
jgi:N-acetylglucosamine-6-phosphate deacetylase